MNSCNAEYILDKTPWEHVTTTPAGLKKLPNAPSEAGEISAADILESLLDEGRHTLSIVQTITTRD